MESKESHTFKIEISIPTGTIKRNVSEYGNVILYTFQFLLVRLKDRSQKRQRRLNLGEWQAVWVARVLPILNVVFPRGGLVQMMKMNPLWQSMR